MSAATESPDAGTAGRRGGAAADSHDAATASGRGTTTARSHDGTAARGHDVVTASGPGVPPWGPSAPAIRDPSTPNLEVPARDETSAPTSIPGRLRDEPDLVGVFLLRLRLRRIDKAASRSKRPEQQRQRLLASSALAGSCHGLPHVDLADTTEPMLWTVLPIGLRADDPTAVCGADHLIGSGSFSSADEAFLGFTDEDEDAYPANGSAWAEATAGPITVEFVTSAGLEWPKDAIETSGRTSPRDEETRVRPEINTAPKLPQRVGSGLSARSNALRRLRLADPSLLGPGIALVAAMLARALTDRPDVAHSLVHEAPVVIVRVPDGVSHDLVVAVVEQCLTEWPIGLVASDRMADDTGDRSGPYARPRDGRGLADDLAYSGPSIDGDDLHGASIDEGWKRNVNVIDATSRSAKAASAEASKTISALQARQRTVIVHAAHEQDLHADVLALADAEIMLEMPDPPAMATVVEAVTGERPRAMQDGLWPGSTDIEPDPDATARHASFTFRDALSSLSPLRGATGSLERLAKLTKARAVRTDRGVSAGSEDAPPLEELAGYGTAREEGLAIAEDLRAYKSGRLGWSSVARGMVLAGPPGTGKSLFARALSRSAGVPLVIGSIGAWQSHKTGHLGDMLSAMRASFEDARKQAPCILFVDELDSVGDRSRFSEHNRDYSVQVVNAFLEQLDGAVGREGVVVCGATNAPERIDPAVLRPGRMERVVWIGLPQLDDLIAMLRTHLNDVAVTVTDQDEDGDDAARKETVRADGPSAAVDPGERRVEHGRLAKHGRTVERGRDETRSDGSCTDSRLRSVGTVSDGTPSDGAKLTDAELRPVALALRGRTGADVAATVRQARAAARRAGRTLAVADLLAATKVRGERSPPESVRWRTAVHEAGHAIAFLALELGTIRSLSLDRDGGTTHIDPLMSEGTRATNEAMLAFMLAGRAAETALLGEPSSGSGGDRTSDLARATRLATAMHASQGLGDGLTWHGDLEDRDVPLRIPPHLHEAVEADLRHAYERALEIVRDRQSTVEALARRLLVEGYIEGTRVLPD